MASLIADTTYLSLSVGPIVESGPPVLVSLNFEVRHDRSRLMSATVSATRDDILELRSQVSQLISGTRPRVFFSTFDEDLCIVMDPASRVDDFFVAIWYGEPYDMMKGLRFAAQRRDLERFAEDLEIEADKGLMA